MVKDKFNLASKLKPAGDQPRAIEKLVKTIKSGQSDQVLLGVTGSGKTFTMANIVAQINKPTLVISHNKTLAAQLASEFQDYFPNNAVHYFVSYYDYYQPEAYIPRTDTYIEKETEINEEIDRLRNAATQSLLTRSDVLIVASVSCIYGLGNPDDYLSLSLKLEIGQEIKRDKVLRRLIDLQYQRNDIEIKRGIYRVRGDVLEIIPASETLGYRISFFGNEIESIAVVNPLTGQKKENLNEIIIFPAKHFVATEDKMEGAIDTIKKEAEERVAWFKKYNKLIEAQRIEQRVQFDIEMIKETGYVNGIENYSRHIDGRPAGSPPSTLIDYFPDNFLLFIDESHMTIPQIRGMYRGDRARKLNLIEYGFRLPSAIDNRPLKFKEFQERVKQAVYVSATPGPYELERIYPKFEPGVHLSEVVKNSSFIAEQIIRPTGLLDPKVYIKPIAGQVDDATQRIKERIARGERALVTTLTKRMAEELAGYLADLGIKVQYLHSEIETLDRLEILRDLRLGKYDVVVGINLLREGLDLPEVSLVLILDADKEGFLRSETSLIQTMGRAARHLNGEVVMYADKITGSMSRAIEETARRRKIQHAYNKKHGITPQTIVKEIKATRLAGGKKVEEEKDKIGEVDITKMNKQQQYEYIHELTDQMELAADNLQFEKAAQLRDEINELKKITKKKRHRI